MGDPIEEYLEHASALEKRAGIGGYGQSLLRGARKAFGGEELGTLAMQTGAVAGVAALAGAARKAYAAATKSRDFKSMLEVNQDLAEHQANDPKMFNQFYNSLRTLNPTFASDPVVAGSYLRKMMEFPHNAGPILVDSVGAAPKLPANGLKNYTAGLGIAEKVRPGAGAKRGGGREDRPPRESVAEEEY